MLFYTLLKLLIVFPLLASSVGCTSTYGKRIAGGMLAGAVVGAASGYQFVHHGQNRQYETRNTIVTSIVFALLTGGLLSWHYQSLEEVKVEISGRYARYRLCDPEELKSQILKPLVDDPQIHTYSLKPNQIGQYAISLDDNTKWAFPTFRKRYLHPEQGDLQVMSERYIWEIIRPGRFVTRSQNPQFFVEPTHEKSSQTNFNMNQDSAIPPHDNNFNSKFKRKLEINIPKEEYSDE